eukprot:7946280-Alexandrium_andersonii.AAC.1
MASPPWTAWSWYAAVCISGTRARLPIVSASQVARLVAKVLPARLNSAAVLWEKLRHEPQPGRP